MAKKAKDMNEYVDFKAFRKDFKAAVAELEKKYALQIDPIKNINYDESTFTFKVTAARTDVDVKKAQFMENIPYMPGFGEEDYLREFDYNGKTYTIIGFKPGNKMDVICSCNNGNQYAISSSIVKVALGKL